MGRILADQGVTYTDIDFNFRSHPRTADLTRVIDSEAIRQSVFNIVQTNPGEAPFDPDFGTGTRELLFEPVSQLAAVQLRTRIQLALENFERRITVNNILITPLPNQYAYDIEINYSIDATLRTDNIPIRLSQLR